MSGEVQNTSLNLPISSEVALEDAWLPLAHAFTEPRQSRMENGKFSNPPRFKLIVLKVLFLFRFLTGIVVRIS